MGLYVKLTFVGLQYVANTPNDENYKYHWVSVVGHNFLIFSVQAENDAHLALSAVPGNAKVHTYEVVIGGWGNSKTLIKTSLGRSNGVQVKLNSDLVTWDWILTAYSSIFLVSVLTFQSFL